MSEREGRKIIRGRFKELPHFQQQIPQFSENDHAAADYRADIDLILNSLAIGVRPTLEQTYLAEDESLHIIALGSHEPLTAIKRVRTAFLGDKKPSVLIVDDYRQALPEVREAQRLAVEQGIAVENRLVVHPYFAVGIIGSNPVGNQDVASQTMERLLEAIIVEEAMKYPRIEYLNAFTDQLARQFGLEEERVSFLLFAILTKLGPQKRAKAEKEWASKLKIYKEYANQMTADNFDRKDYRGNIVALVDLESAGALLSEAEEEDPEEEQITIVKVRGFMDAIRTGEITTPEFREKTLVLAKRALQIRSESMKTPETVNEINEIRAIIEELNQ